MCIFCEGGGGILEARVMQGSLQQGDGCHANGCCLNVEHKAYSMCRCVFVIAGAELSVDPSGVESD